MTNNIKRPNFKINMVLMVLAITCMNFLCLQISAQIGRLLFSLKPVYALVNLGILLAFTGFCFACINKLWVSEAVCTAICVVYSFVNIYVVEFHRSPLTIPEFKNMRTALNVMGGYSIIAIKPLVFTAAVCVICAINLLIIKCLKKTETFIVNDHVCRRCEKRIRILIALGGCVYILGVLHLDKLTEPLNVGWSFEAIAGQYGYPLYFMTSALDMELDEPIGYSEEDLSSIPREYCSDKELDNTKTPDIILILNESFYDVSVVKDVKINSDYMGVFYGIENSISGYAVVPDIGGGTNNSEWELLTGNSTYLLKGATPFQVLDTSEASSIVSNLKELGYYTIGMHPADPGNYARNSGYNHMGFDEIYFEQDFDNKKYYGKRSWPTDASAYQYLTKQYENAIKKKRPIFNYLLTVQNHGDWNTNPSDDDIVHVIDFDNKTYEEKMNEYLSCILLSSEAFGELIEYFEKIDRPVIVCMVGDHAPAFIEEIADNNSPILQRATPFLIWANFPIEEKKNVMVSMNVLGALLLDTAGVNMIPYYRFLLDLSEEVPILTKYGSYVDKDGNTYSYSDDTRYRENIQKYFGLEYNNLQKTSIDEWFSINKGNR